MSRIETEIWEPVKEKNGMVRYKGQRNAIEVYEELKAILTEEGLLPEEYFLMNRDLENQEFPKMADLYCYARWGGNEGIYIDVDLLVYEEASGRYEHTHFATGKTLNETTDAYDRMAYIAGFIYRLMMGDGQEHSRYLLLPKKERKFSLKDLMCCVEHEFHGYLKKILYQSDASSASEKGGDIYAQLVARAKILESLPICCFSETVLEFLQQTENRLEILTEFYLKENESKDRSVKEIFSAPDLLTMLSGMQKTNA